MTEHKRFQRSFKRPGFDSRPGAAAGAVTLARIFTPITKQYHLKAVMSYGWEETAG